MLKDKCSQMPNVVYVEPEASWVKTNTELEIAYFHKEKLHLIEQEYQKQASSISKKTGSNYKY